MAADGMCMKDKRILVKFRLKLIENMIIDEIFLSHMIEKGVLRPYDYEEIKNIKHSHEKVGRLLSYLEKGGPHTFAYLIYTLNHTQQSHLAEMLDPDLAQRWKAVKDDTAEQMLLKEITEKNQQQQEEMAGRKDPDSLIEESLRTSLKELSDEMNTLQAECDDDEDVQLLKEKCSKAIKAVSLICDELKHKLVQEINERGMSDTETLLKWKKNMGLHIANTKSFIRESLSKLSTVTLASATVMVDIQEKLLTEQNHIHAERKKPLATSFHPESLEKEIKTILPNLLMVLMSLSAAVLDKVSKVAKIVPDYTCAPKFQCMYGSQGKGEGQLYYPCGLCLSTATGYLALCDRANHRIQILNAELKHLLTFGSEGSGENQYKNPIDITVNSQGNLFITDTHNHRIQIVSSDGQHLSKFGTKGSGIGQYNEPKGISCDEDDLLHICDRLNYRVQVVKEDGEFVRFIRCIKGDNQGQFRFSPWNITSSREHDRVIVGDGNYNIHFFTHKGQFMKTIKAEQPPYYMKAECVAIDHVGNVIIGDAKRHCLVVLAPNGDLLSTIGGPGKGSGQFNCPRGIAVTRDGCLYVSDRDNHCILLFQVPMKTP